MSLPASTKKVRGARRRLRRVCEWAAAIRATGLPEVSHRAYTNFKIPVLRSLVEGRRARPKVQRRIAQEMINTCAWLMAGRTRAGPKVIALIVLSDFFFSEICCYWDQNQFERDWSPGLRRELQLDALVGRSLARDWHSVLPLTIVETGLSYRSLEEPQVRGQYWMWS